MVRTITEDEHRVALRDFLIEAMGHTEREVDCIMSMLSIIDSRHSRDILIELKKDYQNGLI